jgi:hypothetical protein
LEAQLAFLSAQELLEASVVALSLQDDFFSPLQDALSLQSALPLQSAFAVFSLQEALFLQSAFFSPLQEGFALSLSTEISVFVSEVLFVLCALDVLIKNKPNANKNSSFFMISVL